MGVEIKDAIDFREVCSSVSKKIKELDLPFACRELHNHFMWVCDKDYVIGHDVCHYEIRLEKAKVYKTDEEPEIKIITAKEEKEYELTDDEKKAGCKIESRIVVEIHLEGGSNGKDLKSELIKFLHSQSELEEFVGIESTGNHWYRRNGSIGFPVENSNDNIKAIIEEVYWLDIKFGKDLKDKIISSMEKDKVVF